MRAGSTVNAAASAKTPSICLPPRRATSHRSGTTDASPVPSNHPGIILSVVQATNKPDRVHVAMVDGRTNGRLRLKVAVIARPLLPEMKRRFPGPLANRLSLQESAPGCDQFLLDRGLARGWFLCPFRATGWCGSFPGAALRGGAAALCPGLVCCASSRRTKVPGPAARMPPLRAEVGIGGRRQGEEAHSACCGCSVAVGLADAVCWIA